MLNQEHLSTIYICPETAPRLESDITVPADTVTQQGTCVRGTTGTKKRVFNRKNKSRIYPSRTSCFNCHALVALTSQWLRNTQRTSCIHCYRLIKRTEERIVDDHFASSEHVFIRDAFENVINKTGTLNLVNLSCDEHPDILPYLLMEYVQIRFYFESKRYSNLHFSSVKTVHTNKKLAKTV